MDRKMLVVVSIISSRNFPRRSDCSLIIEAQFNKEVLTTDPIPHVGGNMAVNTELAWEMTKKALQKHKLNRTPIKIQCFAVNKVTTLKENVGYVMLDLRTAKDSSQQDPIWYGVLNSSYSRLKPQLLLALTLEVELEVQSSQAQSLGVRGHVAAGAEASSLVLTLDPSGGFYQLGPESGAQQEMLTLSLTLQNARNLPLMPSGKAEDNHFFFYYSLLGNDITSEHFTPPVFPAERASIRIRCARKSLSLLMAAQQDMPLHLCCGSESLGKGYLSLNPLKSVNRVDCTVPLGSDASIDVIVQLDRAPDSTHQPHPPSPSPSPSPAEQAQLHPHPSAKRNLTQSFEDASLATPTHSSLSASNGVGVSLSPSPPPDHTHSHLPPHSFPSSTSSPMTSRHLKYFQPSSQLSRPHTAPADPALSSLHVALPTPPLVYSKASQTAAGGVAQSSAGGVSKPPLGVSWGEANSSPGGVANSKSPLWGVATSPPGGVAKSTPGGVSWSMAKSPPGGVSWGVAKPPTGGVSWSIPAGGVAPSAPPGGVSWGVAPLPQIIIGDQPVIKGVGSTHPPIFATTASGDHTSMGVALGNKTVDSSTEHRHYKFSIDLRNFHNLSLEPGIKCYLRYNYPFFGCPYPVLVQPPVTLSRGTDHRFTQSFCSFDFASSYQQLLHHTSHQPLTVEVWQSCDLSHDQIVGIAQVPLATVLSQEKVILEGGKSIRQMFTLQAHVSPPSIPGSSHHGTSSLGKLDVVLVVEDLGPIAVADTVRDTKRKPTSPRLLDTNESSHLGGGAIGSAGHVRTSLGKATDHVTGIKSHAPQRRENGILASSEYAVAMELEMWKLAEEEAFKEQLQSRETAHMTQLGEEWRRREAQRQHLLRQKLDHYASLEKQLQEGLEKLQTQQKALQQREAKLSQDKDRLALEQASLKTSHSRDVSSLKIQHQQQLEMEQLKTSEFKHRVDSLKRQVHELEVKVHSREAEFEKYRQQSVLRPESKLQAELSIAQLEKVELERKLASVSKSKQHYKEQWSKALSELALSQQREQATARDKLLTQQQELEAMRAQYFQQEQQNHLKQQLSQVKKDVDKLQEHTINLQAVSELQEATPTSPRPLFNDALGDALNADVTRWIEERDILLQTGVYTGVDPTIQKLDSKIRSAMAQLKDL